MNDHKAWCLIGFPDDEGVNNVGGRIGASKGPGIFREMFGKINGRQEVRSCMEDFDNIPFHLSSLEEKHRQAIDMLRENQARYGFSVLVGGGHDYVYCQLKGIHQAYPDKIIGCINIDPHFDMREPKQKFSSGSPFYVALEEGIIKGGHLIEFGIQLHSNAPELWDFAARQGVHTILFEELRHGKAAEKFDRALEELNTVCDLIIISLDMDSIAAPYAPGVSAPAAEGFTPTDIFEMMGLAGKTDKVCSLGIYELNPNYDIDNRTARLAATSAYYFCSEKLQKAGTI